MMPACKLNFPQVSILETEFAQAEAVLRRQHKGTRPEEICPQQPRELAGDSVFLLFFTMAGMIVATLKFRNTLD